MVLSVLGKDICKCERIVTTVERVVEVWDAVSEAALMLMTTISARKAVSGVQRVSKDRVWIWNGASGVEIVKNRMVVAMPRPDGGRYELALFSPFIENKVRCVSCYLNSAINNNVLHYR